MKKILLLLLCLTLFSGVFAQSFTLSHDNVNIAPGGTIQVLGDPAEEIKAFISITNNAGVAKSVKVKKIIHEGDTLTGTENYFCWDLCYGSGTYVSFGALTIDPAQTNNAFYGDYKPKNIPGISKVMYVFFDTDNRNDSVAAVVEYNASPASVNEDLTSLVKFSEAYPNPAINVVHVNYSIPESVNKATIAVTNMLGSKIMEISLYNRSGKVQIPVSDLINGIYFYSLLVEDKLILTRKFVVKH